MACNYERTEKLEENPSGLYNILWFLEWDS